VGERRWSNPYKSSERRDFASFSLISDI